MAESLDAFRYIGYLRLRWRVIAASCLVAGALALAVSFAMPRQYTATARIVIEPPAGTDVRAAVSLSPIYLESLKTYEQFASGDSLFQTAVRKFGLLSGPIESQKRRVLKVALLRNTRILEISATLPDPRRAQALAQFLAQSTIDLNRSLATEGDRDILGGIAAQQDELRRRLEDLDGQWARLLAAEPVQTLAAESENAATLRGALDQQISNAQLEIADAAERAGAAAPSDAAEIRRQESNARARLEQLRRQQEGVSRQSAEREKVLAARIGHRDRVEAERKTTMAQLAAVENQLRETRGGAAYRGERLRLIDPGIVPERPSSPNVPLNVAAAMLLGLVLPACWLGLALNFQEQRATGRRSGFQALG
jgi:capsular polysaccharide biosynthesis protein